MGTEYKIVCHECNKSLNLYRMEDHYKEIGKFIKNHFFNCPLNYFGETLNIQIYADNMNDYDSGEGYYGDYEDTSDEYYDEDETNKDAEGERQND